MRLTVLGAHGSFPGADGACSGYLLEEGGRFVLLDCGSGVASRLQRYCSIMDLDGIIVSHLHADHMSDLLVLRYGLDIARSLGEDVGPVPLCGPASPEDLAAMLDYKGVFAITPVSDGLVTRLAGLQVSFRRMVHPYETYAVRVQAGGKVLLYSGDTAYNPALIEAAQGADLLLCEASALEGERARDLPHLTARQAGQVAARAGVGRLLLTHYWHEIPREAYRAEARQAFPDAEVAEELVSYEV